VGCGTFQRAIQSRIRKLGEGVVDATLLAYAGLRRLELTEHITTLLTNEEMLPAVAQGAIGIACREGDERQVRGHHLPQFHVPSLTLRTIYPRARLTLGESFLRHSSH
jgi:hydroxymethylbilane synthase